MFWASVQPTTADRFVPSRVERIHVVGEDDISPRIRAELKLMFPTPPPDWDERAPPPLHNMEGTWDSISQGLRWIGRWSKGGPRVRDVKMPSGDLLRQGRRL